MSETDSFIDEVAEEVRRDKLYALFRKYGWIGVALILLLVGGAAWNEWRKAKAEADAQAFGDALVAALGSDDAAGRARALAEVPAGGAPGQVVVRGLLQATAAEEAGDQAGAMAALQGLIDAPGTPAVYRELARLKLVTLAGPVMDAATRDAILADLARPGATFRLLAEEQQALILLGAGQSAEAIDRLKAIAEDAEAPNALKGRVEQILTAVGAGSVPDGQQTE